MLPLWLILFKCVILVSSNRCTNCPQYLPKTVINNNIRFLFVAGLEGTGHHGSRAIFKACAPLCVTDTELSTHLYHGGGSPKGIFVFGNQEQSAIAKERSQLVARFKKLNNGSTPKLYVMNTVCGDNKPGMMSYPNFASGDKVLHHPNIHQLAILAEEAGVDFRVLVLQRAAHEIKISTIDHRHFGSETHEMAVLADNAAVLAGQIMLLDPAFTMCSHFHSLSKAKAWNTYVPGIHPGLQAHIPRIVATVKDTPVTDMTLAELDVFEIHLEAMNSLIEHACIA